MEARDGAASSDRSTGVAPLVIEGLAYTVAGRSILDGCDLTVPAGRSTAVMGRSGSGKSTLLWLVLGLLTPERGTITVAGEPMAPAKASARMQLRRSRIGAVFQEPELIEELGVDENVALPLMLSGTPRREALVAAAACRSALGLTDRDDIGTLSGGERQRVSIARALVQEPSLVVADEPTAALDEETAELVVTELVTGCAERGCALVLVTHNSRVAQMLDATVVLENGRLGSRP